jgi:hypothetical protein
MLQSAQHQTQHLRSELVPVGYQAHSFIFKIQIQLLVAPAQQEALEAQEHLVQLARQELLGPLEHLVELERLEQQEAPVQQVVVAQVEHRVGTEQAAVVVMAALTI